RNMLDQEGAAILLVGPAGVGKTAIVHEVIRILSKAQTSLQHRTDVWEIDGNRFIAGMRYVGAWEERCRSMLEELTSLRDILYVNDLPALVYTGRSAHSNTNVAEFLEPALAQKQIRIIGECTQERLSSIREENPGFFSHFRVIQIDALSEKQTLSVLVQHGRHHESQEDIAITPQAFQNILSITTRFQPNQCFPGKAVRLLQQVLCNAPHQHLDAFGRRKIDHRDVTQYFGQETGLPDAVLWREQARSAHQVKQRFERHIIAQEHAVHALTDIVCTIQQALNDPERPLAALLFVGPTGVGKTESAKALATYLFGSAQKMLRFDMSEYGHPWSVARLIGDRFQPEGELTRQVQNAPFSVVLLDEIEKAHPSVFDALLQVLGEGRLTNAYGRTVDFCNCVVIMTSNLGVKQAGRHVGFTHLATTQMDTHYRKAAEQFFRPEFFNRIDKIVPFRLLQRDAIVPLVQRLLQEVLQRRGLRRRQTMVHVDHDVIPFLIERGFEQRYGARSMKRTLEQTLTLPLAQQLVHTTSAQYTLLQVFVQQNQIQLDIQALHEPHTTMVPEVQSIENWDDLKSRFRHLQDRLETFHNHPQLRAAQEQRSQQIHNINLSEQVSDTPAQNEQTQKYLEHIHTLSTLFSEWNALRQECLTFEEKYIQ
ncbi:MAG: AAA family ATPase, partial [Myxococcota bacterium]